MLKIPSRDEFEQMLFGCSRQIAEFLSRGMRSTAKTRINSYRNLAESIVHEYPSASETREMGRGVARSTRLSEAIEWLESVADPVLQAYGVLGIADDLYPEN